MKKLLSICLFLFISGFVFGQFHKTSNNYLKKNITKKNLVSDSKTKDKPWSLQEAEANQTPDVFRSFIGKSNDALSLYGSERRNISYDRETRIILHTYPADPDTYAEALSSGSIVSAYIDAQELPQNYSEWNTHISANPNPDLHHLAFPSAVLYNPQQSSNTDDIYTIFSGSDYVDGAWENNYFGSSKIDNTENHITYIPMESENDFAQSSMTLVNDEVYIFGQDFENIDEYGINQTLKHYKGTTEDPANGFDWEINGLTPNWLINETDGYAYALYSTNAAWKKDGSIGYMWMVGVTNESSSYGVYQPQVYYTTDGGNNWTYIELDLEDNNVLADYLPPWEDENGNAGSVRPSFLTQDRNYPGAVDIQGKLHLFSNVYGSTTGDVENPDEGHWVHEDRLGGTIFDFVIKPDGLDKVYFVDHLLTKCIADTAFGEIGNTHRLQTTKSYEENGIYVVWSDQDNSEDGYLNLSDIYSWGYAWCSNTWETIYPTRNQTSESLYERLYFYPSIGEYIIDSYSNYLIPITTSLTPAEWGMDNSSDPISHNFVVDVNIHICYNAIPETKLAKAILRVSQNQPNPVKTKTSITINAPIIAPVKIEIRNVLGQNISTINPGVLYQEMNVELDLSKENSGVYFYTVTVGEQQTTKRMVVQ
ncbi:MAG: hypothetical protein B7C24_07175 [Bacteroidetes bacterium 4572_77]|nr:MAG: hypothetical protein B7C24_07175 [Bacteroidetes bacterium 4572_77]